MGQLSNRMVDRINHRLLEFEKSGLTMSTEYQYIKEQIELYGMGTKSGKVRISKSYTDVMDLSKIDKVGGVKKAMDKVKAELSKDGYKPTKKEIKEEIVARGELSQWIKNNIDSIYDLSSQIESGKELSDMLGSGKGSGGLRRYDYDTIWSKIHEFEKARNKWRKKHGNESELTQFTDLWEDDEDKWT